MGLTDDQESYRLAQATIGKGMVPWGPDHGHSGHDSATPPRLGGISGHQWGEISGR